MATTDEAQMRVVVLTGAASGIGAAAARALARGNRKAVLIDRDPAILDQAQAMGGYASVEGLAFDLGDLDRARETMVELGERYGRIDILVNNAGIHPKRDGRRFELEEITRESWQRVLDVNLTAPFLLSQAAFPYMKRHRWGRIINVASRAGRTFIKEGSAHYSASKAGLIGLTRLMAGEGGPFGITVNCVAPGRVVTPLSSEGIGAALHEAHKSLVPVSRVGAPEEIAAAIAYFASEEAGYSTGVVMDVNGGGFMG